MPLNLPPLFEYQDHAYQRTEWMDGNLKPVHVGPYERDYSNPSAVHEDDVSQEPEYCLWNGTDWLVPYETPDACTRYRKSFESNYQDLPWRGLTKPVMEKLA